MAKQHEEGLAAIKALSNPLRMRAYVLLRVEGGKTTGDVADALSCAVGSMSYHLQQLEEAGLVRREPAPDGDGRKTWWVAAVDAEHPTTPIVTGDSDESTGTAFRHAKGIAYSEMYRRYLITSERMDASWREAEVARDAFMRLTPSELREFSDDLEGLLTVWEKRSRAHVVGDGSQQVAILAQAFRWIP